VVKRALFHAVITCVVVVAMAVAVAGGGLVQDPEKFGEGVGRALLFIGGGAFAVSWLAQKGRKTAALAIVVGVLALAGLAVGLGLHALHARDFAAADRAPLIEEAGRLRHPTLGFSVASPGPAFHPAPAMAAVMRASYTGQDAAFYAYADAEPSAILLITAINGRVDLAKELAGLARGMERSAKQQNAPFSIVEQHVAGGEGTLHIVMGEMHARLHAYARDTYAVTVMVMSRDEHALEGVLASLR
jgi:hypothetical protein